MRSGVPALPQHEKERHMTTRLWHVGLLLALGLMVTTGCGGRRRVIVPGGDSGQGTTTMGDAGTTMGDDMPAIAADDLGEDIPSSTPPSTAVFNDPSKGPLGPIYFDYNSADLQQSAIETLNRHAQYLMDNPDVYVQIEGHCDERGTYQYNLALGERRAQSIRKYLAGKGVDPNRLYTISYGEERPAVEGTGEAAWQANRRGEFATAR